MREVGVLKREGALLREMAALIKIRATNHVNGHSDEGKGFLKKAVCPKKWSPFLKTHNAVYLSKACEHSTQKKTRP